MLKDNFYLILFKNTALSRISFVPEVEYAFNVMIQNEFFNKKTLWFVSALGIEAASIINYLLGYLLYMVFNHFKKIEDSLYLGVKKSCSTLILILLLLSFYSNGGGLIVLIAGFLTVNFKMALLLTCISSILGPYIKIFM